MTNHACLSSNGRAGSPPAGWCGMILFLLGVVLVSLLCFLEAKEFNASTLLAQIFTANLAHFTNFFLVSSCFLYIAHLWFTFIAVGRWATGMLTVGSIGLVLDLLLRNTQMNAIQSVEHASSTSAVEILSIFSTVTVLMYLGMETTYRTRSAGALVVPIVVVTVFFNGLL